jgi:uncharacterized protein YceK
MFRFRYASAGLLIAVIVLSACTANTTSAPASPSAPSTALTAAVSTESVAEGGEPHPMLDLVVDQVEHHPRG